MFVARLYGVVGAPRRSWKRFSFVSLPDTCCLRRGCNGGGQLISLTRLFTASSPSVGGSDRVKLSFDLVPLPQCKLGSYCWYVMKRYGDWAPLDAHAINNQGLARSLVWSGRGTYREYQELLAEELQEEGRRGAIGKR